MNVKMLGIDHSKANVREREVFSLTKTACVQGMEYFTKVKAIKGCVILSTCNRMEIYVSCEKEWDGSLYELFCGYKQVDASKYRELFVNREGAQVWEHLFALSSGLKSKIIGEDQILTQVKDALAQARDADCTDKFLEMMFRQAITIGKEIKTKVALHHGNVSASSQMIAYLQRQGYSFQGENCLVIGNGVMGKVTAEALVSQGAKVTVTIRQYRSGEVQIPKGCAQIHYGERYRYIPDCKYVFSATASPNVTITAKEVEACLNKEEKVFVDLAVPRDIEERVGALEKVRLLNIDSVGTIEISQEWEEEIAQAKTLIAQETKEFEGRIYTEKLVPQIFEVAKAAGEEMVWKLGSTMEKSSLEDREKEAMQEKMQEASQKVVQKLLFSLRDGLEPEQFADCLRILQEDGK